LTLNNGSFRSLALPKHDAHHYAMATVYYRWHTLYGQSLRVVRRMKDRLLWIPQPSRSTNPDLHYGLLVTETVASTISAAAESGPTHANPERCGGGH
jgi:hypothetical protein